MKLKILSPKTKIQYESYYFFRWKLLRKPLNKEIGTEKDLLEDSSIHRMVIDNNDDIIAVGRLHHNNSNESQVRYFAVDENFRRQGMGSYLMEDLENLAKKAKRKEIILNARENAVNFYKSIGYKIIQKSYILFDKIQHYEMKKVL
tara:strand:+ start:980 stop:1417 length:438 start_codon:yes stop_codon:yes gene_type:complete